MTVYVKTCTRCEKELETKFFWKGKNYCKDCGTRDRLNRYHSEGGKEKQKIRAFKALLKKYGITPEIYEAEREKQNYCCKICGASEKDQPHGRLHVDHCHDTGMYRGLLCNHCNLALGGFKDNLEVMKKAIDYVKKASIRHRNK